MFVGLSQQTPSVQYEVPRHSLSGTLGSGLGAVHAMPSAFFAVQVPPTQ